MQKKARHLFRRICAMPDIGGQPLPHRDFICPLPLDLPIGIQERVRGLNQ